MLLRMVIRMRWRDSLVKERTGTGRILTMYCISTLFYSYSSHYVYDDSMDGQH